MAKDRTPVRVDNWEAEVKFNIFAVNAVDMTKFFAAMAENDWETICLIFSRSITKLPEAWGNPKNPKDLAELIPYPTLRDMLNLFVEEFKEMQKN